MLLYFTSSPPLTRPRPTPSPYIYRPVLPLSFVILSFFFSSCLSSLTQFYLLLQSSHFIMFSVFFLLRVVFFRRTQEDRAELVSPLSRRMLMQLNSVDICFQVLNFDDDFLNILAGFESGIVTKLYWIQINVLDADRDPYLTQLSWTEIGIDQQLFMEKMKISLLC